MGKQQSGCRAPVRLRREPVSRPGAVAVSLHGIAEISVIVLGVALKEGDYDAAVAAAEEGLRAAEASGEPFVQAIAVGNTAVAALCAGHMDVAEERWCRALEILRRERIVGCWDEAAIGLAPSQPGPATPRVPRRSWVPTRWGPG